VPPASDAKQPTRLPLQALISLPASVLSARSMVLKGFPIFSETLPIFFLCKGRNAKKKPVNNRSLPVKTRIRFLSTLVGAAFVYLPIAQAATITVTNTNDSGAGSLRQALAIANNDDTIDFSVPTPATITLASGQIQVTKSVTINGPRANLLAVNGNANGRVCSISAGYSFPVTVSGLAITNGGNVHELLSNQAYKRSLRCVR
jgi:hypothetical protein